ncbi:MAG TPA: hypothetical protein VFM71_10030 [Gemmatimonadaceae bacterium]|nr:hypothetical protein [Gemmatimonadaceae bacterium]
MRGPGTVPRALKVAVPAGAAGGDAATATRAPQRAQNTSTPGVTLLPHEPQSAVDAVSAVVLGPETTRPPQRGQNGMEGSIGAEQ